MAKKSLVDWFFLAKNMLPETIYALKWTLVHPTVAINLVRAQ